MFEIEIRDKTDGKRVFCARCGGCCKKIAPHIEDILRIGEKYPLTDFLRMDKNDLFLKDIDAHCIFLTDEKLCLIYPIRPDVCKLYPARVEVAYIGENEIICDLKIYSHVENGQEYPRCSGGMIGQAHFEKNQTELLPIAQHYIETLLRERAANLMLQEELKQEILVTKDFQKVDSLMIDYFWQLERNYQKIGPEEAVKILKDNYSNSWAQKVLE